MSPAKPLMVSHACERSLERMGVALSISDLCAMSRKIEAGQSIRLNDRRNGMQQHLVTYNGRAFRVVYAPNTRRVLTVLDKIGKPKGKRS